MIRIIVSGRVQGVFFRENTKKVADELGLVGCVCNLPDGTVEIKAFGDKTDELIKWCNTGSGLAIVKAVKVSEISDEAFTEFDIRW